MRDNKVKVKNTTTRTAMIVWKREEIDVWRPASKARMSFTTTGARADGYTERELAPRDTSTREWTTVSFVISRQSLI